MATLQITSDGKELLKFSISAYLAYSIITVSLNQSVPYQITSYQLDFARVIYLLVLVDVILK